METCRRIKVMLNKAQEIKKQKRTTNNFMFDVVMCVHNMSFYNKPLVYQTQNIVVKVSSFPSRTKRLSYVSHINSLGQK